MPDAVVTGATGNVGSWTVRFLREAGRPVRVAVRDPGRTNFGTGVERVRFDFGRPETYRSAFWGAKKTVPRPPAGPFRWVAAQTILEEVLKETVIKGLLIEIKERGALLRSHGLEVQVDRAKYE